MELTTKDLKFLTILNETRLSDGKMSGRYYKEVSEQFLFSNEELNAAVKKLMKMGMLSSMSIGKDEQVYFHTEKVDEEILDKGLLEIRH